MVVDIEERRHPLVTPVISGSGIAPFPFRIVCGRTDVEHACLVMLLLAVGEVVPVHGMLRRPPVRHEDQGRRGADIGDAGLDKPLVAGQDESAVVVPGIADGDPVVSSFRDAVASIVGDIGRAAEHLGCEPVADPVRLDDIGIRAGEDLARISPGGGGDHAIPVCPVPDDPFERHPVAHRILLDEHADGFLVVEAPCPAGRLPRGSQRGQQQPGKDRDDGDHDEELNERETMMRGAAHRGGKHLSVTDSVHRKNLLMRFVIFSSGPGRRTSCRRRVRSSSYWT